MCWEFIIQFEKQTGCIFNKMTMQQKVMINTEVPIYEITQNSIVQTVCTNTWDLSHEHFARQEHFMFLKNGKHSSYQINISNAVCM